LEKCKVEVGKLDTLLVGKCLLALKPCLKVVNIIAPVGVSGPETASTELR
jgi:hypothetical protein